MRFALEFTGSDACKRQKIAVEDVEALEPLPCIPIRLRPKKGAGREKIRKVEKSIIKRYFKNK